MKFDCNSLRIGDIWEVINDFSFSSQAPLARIIISEIELTRPESWVGVLDLVGRHHWLSVTSLIRFWQKNHE